MYVYECTNSFVHFEMSKNGDWWCPVCEFTIWGSKPKCLKCGYLKPPAIDYWVLGNSDPKWDRFGPYSILKGGYDGTALPDEPKNFFPRCGCSHLQYCPRRHHLDGCRCYTCRCKTHKW